MAVHMSNEEFDTLVDEAFETVPADLVALIDNCLLIIEDSSPQGGMELFGLYEGIPLPERESNTWFTEPDRITIYRRPILNACDSREQVAREIAVTVVHEIGHYFGISEERLHELGWG